EVTRRVPIDPAESSRWRQSQAVLQPDGSVTVPEIYLFEQPLFDDTTVLVDGGTFIMGKDAGNGTPPHERTVPSFYMMEDEVTVEMFATVARLVEKLKDQDLPPGTPMGSVSWGLATDVAEKLGGRLPTEAEFEYAATNAGTTEFPWGNDPSVITEWKFGPVRIADYDVRPGEKPIYGLYSNYAEWTSTPMHSYPGSGPIPEEIRSLWSEARIVRSGDAKVAEGKPGETNFANFARRYRVALDQGERHPQLGFRCVRSAKPRFLP
ncbi:MAG: formylglycine-generating enzyme family protein, partial [Planctomycetaceae bacterium]